MHSEKQHIDVSFRSVDVVDGFHRAEMSEADLVAVEGSELFRDAMRLFAIKARLLSKTNGTVELTSMQFGS